MRSRDSRVFVALLLSFVANGCKDKSVPPMKFQEARGRSNPWIRLIFLRLRSPFAAEAVFRAAGGLIALS